MPRCSRSTGSAPGSEASLAGELAVAALEEEQRTPATHGEVLDPADVDHVVARFVRLDERALDVREGAVEHGHADAVRLVGDALELETARFGEARRQLLLLLGEDVHDEAA